MRQQLLPTEHLDTLHFSLLSVSGPREDRSSCWLQRVTHPTLSGLPRGQVPGLPVTKAHNKALQLTALLAEHKEELCRAVLHVGVDVGHQTHQLVPQRVPHLRPIPHVPERRQHLQGHSEGRSVELEQQRQVGQGKTYMRFTNQLKLINPQSVGDVEKTVWVPKTSNTHISEPSRETEKVCLEDGNNQAVCYSPLSSMPHHSTFG